MHAPGHLREAFILWVEDGCNAPEIHEDQHGDPIFYDGEPRTTRWLLGQLWNCSDTIPGVVCSVLGVPQGTSYAQAVRGLMPEWQAA